MSDRDDAPPGEAFPNDAADILARIQRKNRCVRTVCADMRSANCVCMKDWQAALAAAREAGDGS